MAASEGAHLILNVRAANRWDSSRLLGTFRSILAVPEGSKVAPWPVDQEMTALVQESGCRQVSRFDDRWKLEDILAGRNAL